MASSDKWEGFMIRKDVSYEGKRSNNLLKVKTFYDAEYIVTGCDSKEQMIVRNGKEVKNPLSMDEIDKLDLKGQRSMDSHNYDDIK